MDLIERQKAIDALANTKDLVDVTWTDENDNVIDSIEEKRNIIANWLEKVPSAQRWIPCSERLPEEYGNYLITTHDGNVDIGTIDPKKKGVWSACDSDGFYWLREVIAWMPLPEPYRAERRTDEKKDI